MLAKTEKEITAAPVVIPQQHTNNATSPEFLRLPAPKTRCPFTGLSRSYINLLILPSEENLHKPPVRSFVMRKKGAKTGVRLVEYQSLRRHILANEQESGGVNNVAA